MPAEPEWRGTSCQSGLQDSEGPPAPQVERTSSGERSHQPLMGAELTPQILTLKKLLFHFPPDSCRISCRSVGLSRPDAAEEEDGALSFCFSEEALQIS